MTTEANDDNNKDSDSPVWGADLIGKIINRNERQTFHLLNSGAIKCAKKMGGRWCAIPFALRKEFGG